MARQMPTPLFSGTIRTNATNKAASYVYRAYCRCDDLLYIGVAYDLFTRLAQHKRDRAPWEQRMARLEWDIYATRILAELVEARLIATLHPIYNVAGREGRNPQWAPLPELKPPPSRMESAIAAHRRLALGSRI